MNTYIRPPFDIATVDALNTYQHLNPSDEFTCPRYIDHPGNDRERHPAFLMATRKGWICPHCDYTKDFAFAEMIGRAPEVERVPCDVLIAPATVIRQGCELRVMLAAIDARRSAHPDDCRFDDIKAAKKAARDIIAGDAFDLGRLNVNGMPWGFMLLPTAKEPVPVAGPEFAGMVRGLAVKARDGLRYLVTDDKGTNWILTAAEIGKSDGWLP